MVQQLSIKPFPWKCGHCRQRAVVPATVSYTTEIEHDGRTYTVTVPDLQTPRCEKCGEMVLIDAANRQISDALRRQLGLLLPQQIRQNREALGFTQKQLASQIGVAEATLSRWETGAQIQQRSMDRLLRLFFAFRPVRDALANDEGLPQLGTDVSAPTRPAEATEGAPTPLDKYMAALRREWDRGPPVAVASCLMEAMAPNRRSGEEDSVEQSAHIRRIVRLATALEALPESKEETLHDLAMALEALPESKEETLLEQFSRLVELMKK
jgi:putative zinc finger/helix-turn-helix YgiT family protein